MQDLTQHTFLRLGGLRSGVPRVAQFALVVATASGTLGCSEVLKSNDAKFAKELSFKSYVKSSNIQSSAQFGYSIASDDTSLVVTAPFEDVDTATGVAEHAGAFYVFDLKRPSTSPVRLVAPNAEAGDGFLLGMQFPADSPFRQNPQWGDLFVSLSQDRIALGVAGEDSGLAPSASLDEATAQSDNNMPDAGAVYLYRRADLEAAPQYIKAPSPEAGDFFGFSVSVAGEWLAVGAPGESRTDPNDDTNSDPVQSGAVYLYRYDTEQDAFVFRQYLKAPRIHNGDGFGLSVGLEGDLLAVGEPFEDGSGIGFSADATHEGTPTVNSGAIFVYRWDGTQWGFEAYIKSGVVGTQSGFGTTLRVSNGRIATGSPGASGCPGDPPMPLLGVAYVISQKQGKWSDEQCLSPGGRIQNTLFGIGLALHGDRLVVGALWDVPKSAGSAYPFERIGSGVWQEGAKITAPNRDEGDLFGSAISISSKTIAISALRESGGEAGLHADLSNNSAPVSGAVYLFSPP